MLRKSFFLCLLLTLSIVSAQKPQLSEQAEISALTIGPGASLNDAFGHSAFRVKDPVLGTDLVFNYGVYDFDTPNFYLKFAQGKLNYLIGVNYYEDFYESYVSQNRSIKEQVLNLNVSEKQTLYTYLLNNIKPENRAYLYDFFYDNCATRIRDVLQVAAENPIVYNNPPDFEPKTFRQLIHDHINFNSWGALGIDIALGSVIDSEATPYEYMFLPEYIFEFFEAATFDNSSNKAVVKQTHILFDKVAQPESHSFFTSPLFFLSMLSVLVLYITFMDFKKHRRTKWLDAVIFIITGLIGIFILLLWFATDHTGTHQNYNLLWAFALNIIVISQLLKEQPANWFVKYLKLLVILLCLLTLHWLIGVQVFAPVLIPILIALAVRYIFLIKLFSEER